MNAPPAAKRGVSMTLDVPQKLAILGLLIAVFGYLCNKVVEALERVKSGIEDELRVGRNSSQHQATQLRQLPLQIKLEMIERQISQTTDFKMTILQDKVRLKHAESLATQTSEHVSRLIEKLVLGRRSFKRHFEAL